MRLAGRAFSHPLEGIFPVLKPRLATSNRCLTQVKRVLGFPLSAREGRRVPGGSRSMRVGHGGTLDALAAGVLVVGIGSGCQLLASFLNGSKSYEVRAVLGVRTPSLDMGTAVAERGEWRGVEREHLEMLLPKYRGNILQKIPMFSAKSVNGERLYKLALEGQNVEREERPLTVFKLELVAFEAPYFTLAVESSSGFYVRQLVADLGDDLGCGAVSFTITRTRQGPFYMEDALKEVDWTPEKIAEKVMWARSLSNVG